jgi:hypothetical protein
VAVKCLLPEGGHFQGARVVSPDFQGSKTLAAQAADGTVSFTLPEVRVYSVVALSW